MSSSYFCFHIFNDKTLTPIPQQQRIRWFSICLRSFTLSLWLVEVNTHSTKMFFFSSFKSGIETREKYMNECATLCMNEVLLLLLLVLGFFLIYDMAYLHNFLCLSHQTHTHTRIIYMYTFNFVLLTVDLRLNITATYF